ncbi:hypothetical protein MJC1_01508 [Methylocystis sp. MJC1]|jgi:hypothetical protein|nr:hypothetical protein MJC1_01508 [Methylocystis sp. MJC1]
MTSLGTLSTAGALCAAVAASLLPNSSSAGVMSVADKGGISLPSPANQVDWRPYPHRHHRWHMGWHYGHPRFRYGLYAGRSPAIYGSGAPTAAYGAANPAFSGCGVCGAAYPMGQSSDYDYGGGGLFTTGPGMF